MSNIYSPFLYVPSHSATAKPSEKNVYGNERVSEIFCSNDVWVEGTTVDGFVKSHKGVYVTNGTVNEIMAKGEVKISSSKCSKGIYSDNNLYADSVTAGALHAMDCVDATDCHISTDIVTIFGSVQATRCAHIAEIKAGTYADLAECPHVMSVKACTYVSLRDVKVTDDVDSGTSVTIVNSTIGGVLTCKADHLVIEDSDIHTIRMNSPFPESPLGQVLELHNCRVKYVIFGREHGQVILSKGSIVIWGITQGSRL